MASAPVPADVRAAPCQSSFPITKLGVGDAARFIVLVVFPTWAKGILRRRPRMVWLAERWQFDRHAVRFMQRLRRRYGEAALLLAVAGRRYVVPLAIDDVRRVLESAPDSFTPASREKIAALSHFEPHVSLITRGAERIMRRGFNDEVLESGQEVHHLAGNFLEIVRNGAAPLVQSLPDATLTWPMFTEAWFATVRQIVFGRQAGHTRDLTESLSRLRGRANWVYLAPQSKERARYYCRLAVQVARADPDSLAGAVARRPLRNDEQPLHQITHWLFAFDAGAMTTFRALALFATHAHELSRAGPDLAAWREGRTDLPQLRAGFLDAVRLWPTTPLILRETTETTHWGAAVPKGSGVAIFAPFFHRDDERLVTAHRFAPKPWRMRDPGSALPFVPFSAGPAACPGRHLVALVGAAWLAALLDAGRFTLLHPHGLGPEAPLPATLEYFSIALRYSPAR